MTQKGTDTRSAAYSCQQSKPPKRIQRSSGKNQSQQNQKRCRIILVLCDIADL